MVGGSNESRLNTYIYKVNNMSQHTFLAHKERFWWALHCLTKCKQLSKQLALAAASMRAALEAKGGGGEEGMEGCDEKWYQIAGFPRGTLTHFATSETHPCSCGFLIGMTSEHKTESGGEKKRRWKRGGGGGGYRKSVQEGKRWQQVAGFYYVI